jgi:FMN-dependent NADH-azoreductase
MEMWLRFIGLTDISHIIVEKTLFGPKVDVEARTQAKQRAAPWLRDFKPRKA